MASAIYILNDKGTQLVGRDFRGDLPPRVIEKFIARVRDEEEQHSLKVGGCMGVGFFSPLASRARTRASHNCPPRRASVHGLCAWSWAAHTPGRGAGSWKRC